MFNEDISIKTKEGILYLNLTDDIDPCKNCKLFDYCEQTADNLNKIEWLACIELVNDKKFALENKCNFQLLENG